MAQSNHDQTRFSLEEPLFEDMVQMPQPEPEDLPPKVPLFKQKKFIIGLIVGITVFVLIILYAINVYIENQKLIGEPELPTDSGQTDVQPTHPLLQRIMIAEEELEMADPSEQELIYPSLDYDIRIDPEERE